ncbi:PDT-domain-containing protein [Byssothecium circinans]|uniref:prephenate dehydratase n=1 Tax=Byssothecium circinans TaxID=147558 RepID=A0A6A5TKK6_9PLEO|nr:PDT-domain-containing protein [Byssothecium circinans]
MEAQGIGTEKRVVAFLGPQASYTHQATLDTFNPETHTLSPQITIEDVFSAVQSGTAYRGVVPFENSTNGSVVFTLDLFADLHNKYPDILVCGESYIAVQHCLLGHHQRDDDSSTQISATTGPVSREAAGITKIYSHPQAWGQCKVFLNTYLKGVERQDVSSTSRAAELVARDGSGESAAISSLVAARIFGLGVLARGIEERGDNTTRFFVIRRRDASSNDGGVEGSGADEKRDWKTLVSFTVDHANPGALAHSLAVFEKYGLNLTSINTRPSGVENWNYIFFVEIKGRRLEGENTRDGGEGGDVNKALRDLDRVCRGWRWLGSWENRQKA